MQILTLNVPIVPTLENPTGEYTHLVKLLARSTMKGEPSIAYPLTPQYFLATSDGEIEKVTEDYAARIALGNLFHNAEKSAPVEEKK